MPDRIMRHLLFWIGQFVFWAFLNAMFFFYPDPIEYLARDLRLHSFFIPDIFYTYFVTYFLARRLLAKGKVKPFIISLTALTILIYGVFLFFRFYDYNMFNGTREQQLHLVWVYSMKFVSLGPPVICAMFLTLLFLKNYHLKTIENTILVSENTRSQIGLLKAQIHPHFLFNTLSNIHSFALTRSPVANDLISKLSDTLKYMIYDCEDPSVDLSKELKMIRDYMSLESVRYSNSLRMTIDIDGDVNNKKIVPLFLIPLIENAFKHGTSQVLSDPWIDLRITVTSHSLSMRLRNSKPVETTQVNPTPKHNQSVGKSQAISGFRSGIGLNNVRKRLQLIFPDRHRFEIVSIETEFVVEIQLPLGAPGSILAGSAMEALGRSYYSNDKTIKDQLASSYE